MRKRIGGLTCITAMLMLLLSGCMFRSVDELYELPKTSEEFMNLQATIQAYKGSAESIAPTSGSKTQAIQLEDLLMEGEQEAIAFFRDNSAKNPLKIAIFKKNETGEYSLYDEIESTGSDIESVEYVDLLGGKSKELVVSWQVSATSHMLIAYNIEEGSKAENKEPIMASNYSRYTSADLDGDGKSELFLAHIDSANLGGNRLEMYQQNSSVMKMELLSTAPMSDGATPSIVKGALTNGEAALFITMEFGDNYRVTDVFRMGTSGIRNITMDEATRRSPTARVFTGLTPADINGDGFMEVPISSSVHSPPSMTGDTFWRINWWQFNAEGEAKTALRTYHNNNDRWYLVLPYEWEGKVSLMRTESVALGERAVEFFHWEGDPAVQPEKFMTIYRLAGTNREVHATMGERFRLPYPEGEAIYAAEFFAADWDSGLTQEDLITRFHPITN